MAEQGSERREKWQERKAEAWWMAEVRRDARRESGSRFQASRDASTKRAQERRGRDDSGWVQFFNVIDFLLQLTLGALDS